MKIKSLLMGMAAFLGFALAGCSDDVIDVNNQEQQVSNEPAYLSVSFSVNSSSSRSTADDANNIGDIHGTPDDSGHHNVGSAMENKIQDALVVISARNAAGGYAAYVSNINAPTQGEEAVTLLKDIELTTGDYYVMVVANPYASLYEDILSSNEPTTTTGSEINTLYDRILNNPTPVVTVDNNNGGAWNDFTGSVISKETTQGEDGTTSSTLDRIMMVNKAEKLVNLDTEETETVIVDIERVAAKVTFRPTNNNIYEVEVPNLTSIKIKEHTIGGKSYNVGTINGTTYYVLLDVTGDKVVEVYDSTDKKIENHNYTKDDFTWTYDEAQFKTDKWYVKLEEVALVNLAKQSYNVRHTIAVGDDAKPVSFGTLYPNQNYLYTPYWSKGINSVEFWTKEDKDAQGFTGIGNFKDPDFTTSPWFYNTLAEVSAASASYRTSVNTTDRIYFSKITELAESEDDNSVDGGDGHYSGLEDNTPAIGNLIAYCLENSTDRTHQTHGLSTGITFMGKIYSDPEGKTAVSDIYRYNGYLFDSVEKMQTAFGETYSPGANGIAGLDPDAEDYDTPAGLEKLAAVGVTKFNGNTCYYYTTEIKHFDNGIYPDDENQDPLGVMEFAIMRNNIYSLSVSGINIIGDPWVDPLPGTPDEIQQPKLTVKAKILPWIVRYQDIEFK